MIGGTGTGKSTKANELSQNTGYSIFSADEIEYSYTEQEEQIDIDDLISNELNKQLSLGESFILDGKCLTASERTNMINEATKHGYTVYGHNFGAGTEESRKRRLDNLRDMHPIHWKQVFDFDSNYYESPTLDEGFTYITNY